MRTKHTVTERPETAELSVVLGNNKAARLLASAPGGWRDLSTHELELGVVSQGHED